MKHLASALLMLSLGACTGQITSGAGLGSLGAGPSQSAPPIQIDPGTPPTAEPARRRPPPRERWVELAPPQRNDDTRDFVKVGKAKGKFRRLRFDVARGSLVLRQIVIEFGNGDTQKYRPDRVVTSREPPFQLDLDGRERYIERIIIYTDPARGRRDRGVYRIWAR